MMIAIHPAWARVTSATEPELAWLAGYLSFENSTARYSGGPPKLLLFNRVTRAFPAGFAGMVAKAAASDDISISWADFSKAAEVKPLPAYLRDYQRDAVSMVLKARRGLIHAPTGAGKGTMTAAIFQTTPALRWLFLVHRGQLVQQQAERIKDFTGEDVGQILEGRWDTSHRVTCATFQSISRALTDADPAKRQKVRDWLAGLDGVLVDECHVAAAATFQQVTMACTGASYRIGVSGTPLARGDQKSIFIVGALGPVAYRIKAETLIGDGVLAKPAIMMAEVELGKAVLESSWAAAYAKGVVNGDERNIALLAMALRAAKPALLFVQSIDHGRLLNKALVAAGLKSDFVWGDQAVAHRVDKLADLSAGRLDILIASTVFNEGIDAPMIRSVIIGAGGASVIAALQRIGRGMRVAKDASGATVKSTFEVWDVLDKGCGCDGAHSGCKWLIRHARKRLRAYLAEGHSVQQLGKDMLPTSVAAPKSAKPAQAQLQIPPSGAK